MEWICREVGFHLVIIIRLRLPFICVTCITPSTYVLLHFKYVITPLMRYYDFDSRYYTFDSRYYIFDSRYYAFCSS